jgi:hypothetical protein
MPAIAMGNGPQTYSTFGKDFKYTYPEDLNLKPGSPLHTKLKDMIMEKAMASSKKMSARHKDWNSIDHTLTAYIPASEAEKKVKYEDSRKPISVVFPYSYTILETLLSYYVSAFVQDPIFRYEGQGPGDVIGAILLEKMIAYQCIKNKVGLNLHTQARDAFAYGFGAVTPTWITEYGKKTVTRNKSSFLGFGGGTQSVVMDNQLLFEGNALENIDPYLYLPDPTVPIHDPQAGESNGWIYQSNYLRLLENEQNSDVIFNVKYLKELTGRRSCLFTGDNSGRSTKSGLNTRDSVNERTSNAVDIIKMYVKLVPNDWGLGTNEYPENWYFELASDEVLIQCRPVGLEHNKFPVSVIAPDFDGYSLSPVSRIEMLYGMQGILDFLFNSHVENVRKAINDMIIYDPYLVNSEDLKNPAPGKLIRLRRPAWGRGVKDVAQQLAISDVTRANVQDSAFIIQWMDRISGADSTMQGAVRQGGPERLTSSEFQGTRAAGVNRLERIAKVVGMQGMQDIGFFFAAHNKQMMESENYIKLAGDWQEVLMAEFGQTIDRGRIKVSPADLNVNADIIVRDGSVPGGNYSGEWTTLFQTLAQNPELAQKFDVVRIFTHIARNLGAKNVNDFVRKGGQMQSSTMPTQQLMDQAQAGNMVPVEQMPGMGMGGAA